MRLLLLLLLLLGRRRRWRLGWGWPLLQGKSGRRLVLQLVRLRLRCVAMRRVTVLRNSASSRSRLAMQRWKVSGRINSATLRCCR